MARIGKLLGIIILLLGLGRLAYAGTVTGELDKPEGSLEDQFVYTLSVQGSADGEPAFPDIPGLTARHAGSSQSVSIVNGAMSREVQYQFVLTPAKEGTYTIPPVQMKVDGKVQQTLPIEFKVNPAGTATQGSAERPIFMERTLSRNKIYVGESVLSSIRIFSRVRMLGAQPDFQYPDGFQVKPIDGEKTYSKVIDGQNYAVNELNALLTPSKAGKFELPAAGLDVRFIDPSKPRRSTRSMLEDIWGSANTSEKRFRSSATPIEVLPLPVAGRRADFSGLVGTFEGSAQLSPASVKTGETATLTLLIQGQGSTGGMADPELALGDRAKVYKDKPQSQDAFDSTQGVLGQRSFKIAIVPARPGELDLGTLNIQFFNSTKGQYEDMKIPLGTLHVTGTAPAAAAAPPTLAPASKAEQLAPSTPPAEVRSLASDLLEPHTLDRLQGSQGLSRNDIWSGAGLLLLALALLGAGGWRAWIRRQGGARDVRKKAGRALHNATRQLKEARQMLDQQDVDAAVGLAQNSIRQYLGDKFSIKGSALTLRDLELQLENHGLSAPTIEEMRRVWQNLDQLRFGAGGSDSNRGLQALQTVDKLLAEVEQRC